MWIPLDQQVVWIGVDKPRIIHQEIRHNREPWLGRPQWQYQNARSMFHFDFGENSTQDTKRRECIKQNILPIKEKASTAHAYGSGFQDTKVSIWWFNLLSKQVCPRDRELLGKFLKQNRG